MQVRLSAVSRWKVGKERDESELFMKLPCFLCDIPYMSAQEDVSFLHAIIL